jgi:hypothetical protein
MASLSRFVLAAILVGPVAASCVAAEPPAAVDKPAEADKPADADKAAPPKMVCRTTRMTGSNLRQHKVCSTSDSEAGAGDWVRQQQERGGLNASGALNGRGG